MSVAEPRCTGPWVDNLALIRSARDRVPGLSVPNGDADLSFDFISAWPDAKHHEFVAQTGRIAEPEDKKRHQISWRVETLDYIWTNHTRLTAEGVRMQQQVPHGHVFGTHFFDPGHVRSEVHLHLAREISQLSHKSIDFGPSPEETWAGAERLINDDSDVRNPAR